MHVDDNLYADVRAHLVRTICASVASLFDVLGPPTNPLVPSPLSGEKFESWYNHMRKLVGRRFNSRTLSVGMLPHKRAQLVELLQLWATRVSFDLLEIAHLLGTLENHTKYARWARCWCCALQNAVRRALVARFHIVQRRFNRRGKELHLRRELPSALLGRIESLILRERAKLLWTTRQRFTVDIDMKTSISHLLAYVQASADPWEVPLGLIVPREPHFSSRGDASKAGGGAYCLELRFWFDVIWSPRTVRGVRDLAPSADEFVHINSLEFIVVVLQLAAVITRIRMITPGTAQVYFPTGTPSIPVWFGETDNTVSKSWENRATARTSQGQGLVSVYAELLRVSRVHTQCEHLAGVKNIIADDISRNDFSLSLPARAVKLFHKHPCLEPLDYFRPSPELVQLLTLRLYSRNIPVPCILPTVLGQFQSVGSTTSGSAVL
ncbi:hypothetical protein SEMRO_1369_G266880.1 [Seminavis robusta]|uniref:Uncharacterized protein n=1 Tax=Seminavis robusta TaxID=568900 RepID=A0A9N8EQ19_9STRA|nr:hypothetical protein SEMRO_1369_G266880.1 [Seminavis robusta]|eukprot:Sro1369_g266880.1 n/a (438) ;mRNA; r:2676-3989